MKTLQKGYQKRHNFSQTKFVCHQKPKDLMQRKRKPKQKGSVSKSSGKKRSRTGSSQKKSKSKSLSEQNRLLHNELAHQSFDIIDNVNPNFLLKKNQTTSDVRRNNTGNQSLKDLQRKVLENQKMLIGLLSKQRDASGDSSQHHSGD